MAEKKDRRSKRDKLKDNILADIQERIDNTKADIVERDRLNESDRVLIGVLEDQVKNVGRLCDDEGGETES